MAAKGWAWATYDRTYRMRRARKVLLFPETVSQWSKSDVVLFVECGPDREERAAKKPATYKAKTSSTTIPIPSIQSNPHMPGTSLEYKSGTCWKFQAGKDCGPACSWPDTHVCYTCGGPHPTKACAGVNQASNARKSLQPENSKHEELGEHLYERYDRHEEARDSHLNRDRKDRSRAGGNRYEDRIRTSRSSH